MRNPLTLEAFAEWAGKQPADGKYTYADATNCAFCQYLRHVGFPAPAVSSEMWTPRVGDFAAVRRLPSGLNEAVAGRPRTFGALAARLREAQGK